MNYLESLKKLEDLLKTKQYEEVLDFGIGVLDDFEETVDADYYFIMAKAALALRRYANAEYYLLKTNASQPEHLNSLLLLAKIKIQQEEYALAESFLDEILTKKANYIKAIALLAEVQQKLGMTEEAETSYQNVIQDPAFSEWSANEQTELLLKAANHQIEQTAFKAALDLVASQASKQFNEALEYMQYSICLALGKEYREELIASGRKLYEQVPNKLEYGLNLTQWIKDQTEKESILTHCLSLDLTEEQQARVLAERAYLRVDQKNWQGALEDYNQLLELEEDSFFYQKRAICKENTGNVKEALQDLTTALKMEVEPDLYILEQRALLFGKAKAYDRAIADLKTILKLNSGSNASIYYNLGVMYSKKGEKSDAVKMLIRSDQEGYKKATEFLIQKYPEQLKKVRSKNQSSLKEAFSSEASRNAKSPILAKFFSKLWVVDMPKFIDASMEELKTYPASITKMVLDKLSKEMFIITEDGILLFEGDSDTPIEALYRVEVESEHSILLEVQPTKGGPSSNMRISAYEDNLLMHYPVAETDTPPKYYLSTEEVSPEQAERLNNKSTGLPYLDSIETVIGQLS
jgi:tetratricopeptide (TPR) repeat protein